MRESKTPLFDRVKRHKARLSKWLPENSRGPASHVCTVCHSPTRPRRRWGAAAGLGLLLLLPILGFSAIIFMHIPKTGGPIFNYNGEAYVSDLYLDTALYWAGVVLFAHLLRSDTRCRSCGSKATVPFSTRMGQAIERRYPSGVPQPRKETSP